MVTVYINAVEDDPIVQVKRSEKWKGPAMISQLHVFARYNAGMGEIDILNRSRLDYKPAIREKK